MSNPHFVEVKNMQNVFSKQNVVKITEFDKLKEDHEIIPELPSNLNNYYFTCEN